MGRVSRTVPNRLAGGVTHGGTEKPVGPLFGEPPRAGEDDRHLGVASGLTDKAIANHLGCSPRTLQRKLQSLYTDLGTDTRFQAGVAATQRGWVAGVEAP